MPSPFVFLLATAVAADVPTKRPEPPVAGRQHYAEHCWACHGKRALGDGPSRTILGPAAPPLAGLAVSRHPEARAVVLGGRGAMPAYRAVLAPDEIDTILVWLSDLDPQTGEDPHRTVKKKSQKKPGDPAPEPGAPAPKAGQAPAPTNQTVPPSADPASSKPEREGADPSPDGDA